jgi:hypothetical protein
MPDSYKVMRAFQRYDGKTLRTHARGSIISAKDAAKMNIKDPKKYPRGNPLQTLIRSGAIYRMPEDNAHVGDLRIGEIQDHSKMDLIITTEGEVAIDGGRPS